jgi:hypothetical protein
MDSESTVKHLIFGTGLYFASIGVAKIISLYKKKNADKREEEIDEAFRQALEKKKAVDDIIATNERAVPKISDLRIIRAVIVKKSEIDSFVTELYEPLELSIDVTETFRLYTKETKLILPTEKSNRIGYLEPPRDLDTFVILVFYKFLSENSSESKRKVFKLTEAIELA